MQQSLNPSSHNNTKTQKTTKKQPATAIYKPSENEEYMNPRQIEYFTNKLLKMRAALINNSNVSREHLSMNSSINECDEINKAAIECDITNELEHTTRITHTLEEIEKTLKRIKTGEYGYCEATGAEIGIKRLKAMPTANLCIEAQKEKEEEEK